MIILEKPYVSDFLKETCLKNNYPVLENDFAAASCKFNFVSPNDAAKLSGNPKVYINSENALSWVMQNLTLTNLPQKADFFKDKHKFRKLLKQIYPDFYFEEINFDAFKKINPADLRLPLIVKPSIGFLSMGVYPVYTAEDWSEVIRQVEKDLEKQAGFFPPDVMNFNNFLLEEFIDGKEYAVDAFFDAAGRPVILNIYEHPFLNDKDVLDRVYMTSGRIMEENLADFETLLAKIGAAAELKNFPVHMELRKSKKGIIPIEINPLRFAGMCNADLAFYAYGINPYECFFEDKRPDWKNILSGDKDEMFYFNIAEIPSDIERAEISGFDTEKYLKNIANPLEVRTFDPKTESAFTQIFARTKDYGEIKNLLSLNMPDFILR